MQPRPRSSRQPRPSTACEKSYSVEEALGSEEKLPSAKFDESVDMSLRLGVDPKHADEMVRGAIVLPHGIGKAVGAAVFAKGEKEKEAREAGADVVEAEDLVEKIQGGFMDFDSTVATPDGGEVGRLGKARAHAEPEARDGCSDVARAVREVKVGKVEFRVDKAGTCTSRAWKKSFHTWSRTPGPARGDPRGPSVRGEGTIPALGDGVLHDGGPAFDLMLQRGGEPLQEGPIGSAACPLKRRRQRREPPGAHSAKTAVLTEYRGLTVRQLSDLRKQLKAASAEYKVVQEPGREGPGPRFARHPLQGADRLSSPPQFPAAKALQAFVRVIRADDQAGIRRGQGRPARGVRALWDLPSKEALRSQPVGALQQLASLLTAPQRELVQVLEARSKSAAQ